MPDIICEQCQKPFHVPPGRGKTARWCSNECSRASGKGRKQAKIKNHYTCPMCGKDVFKFPSWVQGKAVYCSRRCVDDAKIKWPKHKPTDPEWAWLAGFIDGEGTFTWGWARGTKHQPRMTVSNTNKPVMEYINDLVGGSPRTEIWRINRWRPSYKVTVSAKMLLRWIMDGIGPYVRLKTEHIKCMRALLDNPFDEEAAGRLKFLNYRGSSPPTDLASKP